MMYRDPTHGLASIPYISSKRGDDNVDWQAGIDIHLPDGHHSTPKGPIVQRSRMVTLVKMSTSIHVLPGR